MSTQQSTECMMNTKMILQMCIAREYSKYFCFHGNKIDETATNKFLTLDTRDIENEVTFDVKEKGILI